MPTSQRHDCAVAFCCDRNYYHLALFMIRQIAFHNPNRSFDFVVASQDTLEVPAWAKDYDIMLHRTGEIPADLGAAWYQGSMAPLYRLTLARELGDRYRRILYLDCDMFVEGGDLNRLMAVDIGPNPIGCVQDAPFLYEANYRAREYAMIGWPAAPYANTGLQLIDTKAYVEQEVERRSYEACRTYPQAMFYADQSVTNIALKGKFAQLAPCWNWQWNYRLLLVPHRYPVFLRHFVGPTKPDRESKGLLEARFNDTYRSFLTQFMPELLPKLAPPSDPTPMSWQQASRILLRHIMARGLVTETLKQHSDPYKAIF